MSCKQQPWGDGETALKTQQLGGEKPGGEIYITVYNAESWQLLPMVCGF